MMTTLKFNTEGVAVQATASLLQRLVMAWSNDWQDLSVAVLRAERGAQTAHIETTFYLRSLSGTLSIDVDKRKASAQATLLGESFSATVSLDYNIAVDAMIDTVISILSNEIKFNASQGLAGCFIR